MKVACSIRLTKISALAIGTVTRGSGAMASATVTLYGVTGARLPGMWRQERRGNGVTLAGNAGVPILDMSSPLRRADRVVWGLVPVP
jgi:hypothetical protein